ncbi:FG-GAP-like repeat-containing protein [Hymenobacter sp. ASUV-10]|uniref:FG-GAP-like repeat-containing protein n=1 Tax=Hymenobacter aranciens TaxID=3063996 RepID=A0ABT9BHW4_9BACT|nr:FG-GAP-like repeat-containing protein [Hymenobacter sp. ASUV-10]MDO7877299.1 FG-GAP-like repeat-containing protein [Hymenobacter sp. ASUV-10]
MNIIFTRRTGAQRRDRAGTPRWLARLAALGALALGLGTPAQAQTLPVTSGLYRHFRADAGVSTDGSGNVTVWADQSPNATTAIQSGSAQRPALVATGLGNKPTLRFDGADDVLSLTSNVDLTSGGLSIFVVGRNAVRKNYNGIFRVASALTGNAAGIEIYWQAGSSGSGNAEYTANRSSSGSGYTNYLESANAGPAAPAPYIYGMAAAGTTSRGQALNGTTSSTNGGSGSYLPAVSSPAWLGVGYAGTSNVYLNGDLSEVIIYNREVTTAEQTQIETYLSNKYNIATAANPTPLTSGSPVSSGLRLHLAADQGLTSSGGTVTAWADLSGNGFGVAQATAGQCPALTSNAVNGKPALSLDGNDDWLQSTGAVDLLAGQTNYTFFAVTKPGTTQKQYADIFDYSHSGGSRFVIQQDGNSTNTFYNNGVTAANQVLPTAGFSILGGTFANGGTGTSRLNGGNALSGPASTNSWATPANFRVGNWSLTGREFNGQIAEVLVFNRVLTATEIGQVETYLGSKYAIALASTVPTLSSVTPARHAPSAARSSDISLTFSAALNSASASATALKVFGNYSGLRGASYSGGGSSTLTINPTTDFRAGEQVSVTVTTAAQSDASNTPLGQGYVSQFVAASGAATGTFSGSTNPTANRPVGVAAADFNGDGNPDLVAANYQGGMAYYQGNGNGGFAAAVLYNAGAQVHSVATGDLDNDGDVDVVAANYSGSNALIYLNNGSGTFVGSTAAVGAGPTCVALGDVDGDGDLDLVTAGYSANTASIRLNNGSGIFAGGSNLSLAAIAFSTTLGDVDNDGDLDLLATRWNGGNAYLYLNNGSGSFGPSASTTIATGTNPGYASFGDLDGDGFLDIVIPNYGSNTLTVAWGSGTGSFTTASISGSFSNPVSAMLGDADGDGRLDVVVSQYSSANALTIRNLGGRTFATPVNVSVQTSSYYAILADLNNDDALDLVSANYGGNGGYTLSVRLNTSVGVPTISSFAPASGTVGSTVVVTGTNLNAITSVTINGVAATTFSTNSGGTQLTVTVPAGASTGLISVTNASGTATSSTSYTVLPAPTISSFTPTSAAAGATVTITGTNLTGVTGVLFGGVPAASFSASSNTSLTATPAVGGASGVVTLLYGGSQSVSSAAQFSFLLPNITRVEYFIDTDPGFGAATALAITPGADLSGLTANINVGSLTTGFHAIGYRSQDANGQWSITTRRTFYFEPSAAQALAEVNKVEYFIDTDPGFGLATDVPVTAATDISNLSLSVSVGSLSTGFHSIGYRSRDANGQWSLTNRRSFYFEPTAAQTLANVNKVEYFVDTDPGFGLATDVPVTAATDISGIAYNINLGALTTGFHTIGTRSRDANGQWSLTSRKNFYYEPTAAAPLANIDRIEYFLDTDPGFGLATAATGYASLTNVPNVNLAIDLSSASTGFHSLGIRSRDADGKWSLTNRRTFYYEPTIISLDRNITRIEYYLDTDPGFGLATDVTPANSLSFDFQNVGFQVNLSSLSAGFHTLNLRSKDDQNKWSLTNRRTFYYEVVAAQTLPNITRIEYYFDTDPGFGSATAASITAGPDLNGVGILADASALADGTHRLFIRSQDASGKWSLVSNLTFLKSGCGSSANIAANLPTANYTQSSAWSGSAQSVFNGGAWNAGAYSGTVQVDMTTPRQLTQVRYTPGASPTTSATYTIQVSSNMTNWTTVDTYSTTVTAGSSVEVVRTLAVPQTNVRGLRLVASTPSSWTSISNVGAYDFNCNGPAITSFTPTGGAAGTTVNIVGTNLAGVTSVSFNGTAVPVANITNNTATGLTVVAPAGGTSGQICLVATAGSTCSAQSFQYPPTITTGTVSPQSFCASTYITVPFSTLLSGYNAGNQFGFQLSDASGVFSNGSRIYNQSVSVGPNGGSITDTVAFRTPAGNGYRVRVVSTNPVIYGTPNPVNLTIHPTPVATAAASATTVVYNGSTTLTAGPAAQNSYQWYVRYASNGGTSYVGSGASLTLSNMQPSQSGKYFVYVSNSNGCQDSASVRVTVQPSAQPILAISQFGGSYCAGSSNIYFSYVVQGNSFPSGNTVTAELSDASGSFTSPTVLGTVPFVGQGTGSFNVTLPNTLLQGSAYRVRLTASTPFAAAPATNGTNLTINAPPLAVAGSNSPVAYNGTIQLTAQTAGPGASYQWYGPNFYSTQQNPTINNATTAQNQGTYQLVVTQNGCQNPATTTVVVSPSSAPILTLTQFGGGPFCAGTSTLNIGFNVTGNSFGAGNQIQAQLSDASGSFGATTTIGTVAFTGQGNGIITVAFPAGTPAGSGYRVRLVGTNPGVPSQTDNGANLVINAAPVATIVSNNSPVAYSGTVTLTTQAVSGATYVWSVPGFGNVSTGSSPTLNFNNATPANSGTYTVYVTVAGCSSSTTASVTVLPAGQPIVAISQFGGSLCAGASLSIGFNVSGANHSGSLAAELSDASGSFGTPVSIGSVTFNGQGNGSISATIPVSTAQGGLYRIRLTSGVAITANPATNGSNLSISATPIASASSNSPVAAGGTINLLAATTLAGTTYSWTGPNGYSAPNQQNPSINNATSANAGTYVLTTSLAGCSTQSTVAVSVNTPSATLATGSFSGSFCPGSFVTVPFTATGFDAGNVFTAQLSSASGSFASPVNIGAVSGASATSISAQIPVGTAAGTGYRIRVVGSSPAMTSSTDNGANLTVGAITFVWTGAAGTADWYNAANWSCGQVPTNTSVVVIPGTGVTIYPIVTGTTAVALNLTVQAGATFTVNGTFNLYGNVTVNGSWVAGNSSSWHFAGGGTHYVYGGSYFYANNLYIGTGNTLNLTSYNSNFYVSGGWYNDGSFLANTGAAYSVIFNGNGTQCICGGSATTFYGVQVLSGATVNLGIGTIFHGNVVVDGTFNALTYGVTFMGTVSLGGQSTGTSYFHTITIATGAVVTLVDDIIVRGDWINDGQFTGGTYSVTFGGNVLQIIGGTQLTNFYNVVFQNTLASVTLHQNIYVLGSFVNTGTFYGWYLNGGVVNGYYVRFGGSSAQVITANTTTYFYHFYVSNTVSVSLATNIHVAGNFYLYTGVFNPATYTINFNGTEGPTVVQTVGCYASGVLNFYGWNIFSGAYVRLLHNATWLGGFVNNGTFYGYDVVGGVYTYYTSYFGGTVAQVLSGTGFYYFGHIRIDNSVAGGVTFGCPVYVRGNWYNGGVFFCGTSTVYFDGTEAQLIDGSTATTFYHVNIGNTALVGGVSLAQAINVTGNWLGMGRFFGTGYLTSFIGSALQTINCGAAGYFGNMFIGNNTGVRLLTDIRLDGNWGHNGGFLANGYTVYFVGGSGTQFIGGTATTIFHHLNIASTATVQLNRTITLTGNWINDGSFLHNSLLVYFNGTVAQYIGGLVPTTFYHVTFGTTAVVNLRQNIYVVADFLNNGGFYGYDGTTGYWVRFSGSATQIVNVGPGAITRFHHFYADNAVAVQLMQNVYIRGDFYLYRGVFQPGTYTCYFNGITQSVGGVSALTFFGWDIATGSTVTLNQHTTLLGNFANAGTFHCSSPYGFTFGGSIAQVISGAGTFNFWHVIWDNAAGITLNQDIFVLGDWTNRGGFLANGHLVTFKGTATQYIGGLINTVFHHLTIENGATVQINRNISLLGNWLNNGSFLHNSLLVLFNHQTVAQTCGGTSITRFYDVTFANPVNVSLDHDIDVVHNFINSGGFCGCGHRTRFNGTVPQTITCTSGRTHFHDITFDNLQGVTMLDGIYVSGLWVNNGGFLHNNQLVIFDGTALQTIGGTAALTAFYNVGITNAVNVQLLHNITVAGYWNNTGIFTGNGFLTTFNGTASQTITTGALPAKTTFHHVTWANPVGCVLGGDLYVTGNWLCNGPFNPATWTVYFNGTTAQTCGGSAQIRFHGINVSNTTGLTCNGPVYFTGNFVNTGLVNCGTYPWYCTGTSAQTIGGVSTTPTRFYDLVLQNASGVTATDNFFLTHVLTLSTGNLASNGHLTLVSNASGTAMVVNPVGGGEVTGEATMERFITGLGGSPGYRHYASPMKRSAGSISTTVQEFADDLPVFELNTAYNTAGNSVTPFPTLFKYEEPRLSSTFNNFDRGWMVPTATEDLEPMRGYTAQTDATTTVDIKGLLQNGNVTTSLTRGSTSEAGWQLIGNPYPAPMDWDVVRNTPGLLTGIADAIYVHKPTGRYTGSYASYINGLGQNGGSKDLAAMQGFFVRATSATASVSMTNAVRATAYVSPTFNRPAPTSNGVTARPVLRLEARTTTGLADEAVIYFEPGAGLGFSPRHDAYKMQLNGAGRPSLWSQAGSESFAINGLPEMSTERSIPLGVRVSTTGQHELVLTDLSDFPAGTQVWLEDTELGRRQNLILNGTYAFTMDARFAGQRFYLNFVAPRTAVVMSTTAKLEAATALYPNPTTGRATVELSGLCEQGPVRIDVVNTLGQVLLQRSAQPRQGIIAQALDLRELPAGVYSVRLHAQEGTVVKRLVKE